MNHVASTRRRILVVDDNRDAAASLAMMLSLLGHDTRTAHDGLEAVELAEAFRPDVMLLDIGLPKLNGYDACRRIREQPWGQGMFIVAVTGWGQDGGPPALRRRPGSITTWSSPLTPRPWTRYSPAVNRPGAMNGGSTLPPALRPSLRGRSSVVSFRITATKILPDRTWTSAPATAADAAPCSCLPPR